MPVFFCEFCEIFNDTYFAVYFRTAASDRRFFVEMFKKFRAILKSSNGQMLPLHIVYTGILKGS